MKLRLFTTEHLNTYLLYFLPDRPGQIVASLPNDDNKEILYHTMPITWETKMLEQGYNYLDDPIHAIAEFFETRIKNLEIWIPASAPSRSKKKSKRGSKKRRVVTFKDLEDEDLEDEDSEDSVDEDSEDEHKGKRFCQ